MRIVVVLVVPCVGLSDFLHVAPQRGINVDLSVESLKHVFGDVAGVTHRRFFNQVGRIVGSNKVGELFEQRVCGGRSGYVLDVAAEQVRVEDHALFSTLLVALDIIESAEFNCSCIAGGLIQGSIKGLFLLVGHVECVIRICSGGSRCSCCNRAWEAPDGFTAASSSHAVIPKAIVTARAHARSLLDLFIFKFLLK